MKKQLLLIAVFLLLNCSSDNKSADLKETKASKEIKPVNLRISFDSLDCPINFEDIDIFSVSKLNNKKSKVDKLLFYKLFQYEATERKTYEGSHLIPATKHTKEYLLTKHKIDDNYDFITLLKETNEGNKIYWFSYFSIDTIIPYIEPISFEKGTLTNWGILSEEYENDTINFRSYTDFFEKNKVIVTEITTDKRKNVVDSVISFLELAMHPFNDGFKALWVGEKCYLNGKLKYIEIDDEVEWIRDIK